MLLITDAASMVAGIVLAHGGGLVWLKNGTSGSTQVSEALVGLVLLSTWLIALVLGGVYDRRYLGVGVDEYRRLFDAALRFAAFVAIAAFVLDLGVARTLVVIAIPLATILAMTARYLARRWLHHQRARRQFTKRVVVVGTRVSTVNLVRDIRKRPFAGIEVTGVCVPGISTTLEVDGVSLPVLCGPNETLAAVRQSRADGIAIADTTTMSSGALNQLAWGLAGTGIELMVAPAVTDVAGPRISVRPIEGVPLLLAEQPELGGARRVAKGAFDRTYAAFLLVLLLPVFLIIGLLVRLTSRGPALFRQVRVGLDGRRFVLLKFRTMSVDAEARMAEVVHLNEHDGVLFKVRNDPRITPFGRYLRRWSIDELPQLWNVVCGDMSMIGPRPPLPAEVDSYSEEARRRLLVKPGMTGLWQVSGRASLGWEEAVRLDLYYVENWSPSLDAVILFKTLSAVVRRQGAF